MAKTNATHVTTTDGNAQVGQTEAVLPPPVSGAGPRGQGPTDSNLATSTGKDPEPGRRCYMILSAKVDFDPSARIDTAQGLKLKLSYEPHEPPLEFFPKDGCPIKGKILGGSDWVLIRRDGVLVFDGRVTLSFDPEGKADNDNVYIIDATIKGMLDLEKHVKGTPTEKVFDQFVRGNQVFMPGKWPVRLSMRFEGSDVPPPREDTSWLPKRLQHAIKTAPLPGSLASAILGDRYRDRGQRTAFSTEGNRSRRLG